MIKKMLSVLPVVVITMLLAGARAGAQEFSADMVSRDGEETTNAKIYVGNDKVRMEMPESIMIIRRDKNVTWMVIPSDKMYMEQPIDLAMMSRVSRDFSDEIERVSMGTESVDGQEAEKFKVTYIENGENVTVYQWLRGEVPVKTEAEDGSWSTEYKNLEIGPQPADLFEPPADYEKFEMPGMGDMLKNIGSGLW